MKEHQVQFQEKQQRGGAIALLGLAILPGSLVAQAFMPQPLIAQPLIAQSAPDSSPILTPADRALFLIQNEAAVRLNTYFGNINVVEFGSRRIDNQVIGYEATVAPFDNDQAQLFCTVDQANTVICQPWGAENPTPEPEAEPVIANRGPCAPEHRQITLLEQQFIRQDSPSIPGRADYAVRIYEAIDDSTGHRQICMNIYNLIDNILVGMIPARVSTTATAYYSDTPLGGIDHQVLFTQDNRSIYRQSQEKILLYEGYSR